MGSTVRPLVEQPITRSPTLKNHSRFAPTFEVFVSTFLSAFVLAAYIRAALRGGPLSFFDLRYAAPEGLARPGELLSALSAEVAARELACDGSGRFSLAPVEAPLVAELHQGAEHAPSIVHVLADEERIPDEALAAALALAPPGASPVAILDAARAIDALQRPAERTILVFSPDSFRASVRDAIVDASGSSGPPSGVRFACSAEHQGAEVSA